MAGKKNKNKKLVSKWLEMCIMMEPITQSQACWLLYGLNFLIHSPEKHESLLFSPHNFGLWEESRAHTLLPQRRLPGRPQLSPDMQNGFGTHRGLQASQRQEVI